MLNINSYIHQLAADLHDVQNPLTTALLTCGQPLFDRLRSNAETLLAQSLPCHDLAALRDIARQKMTSSQGSALAGWIRLYTDASILSSLANLHSSTAPQSIAELDHVLIFCGSACGRVDLVLSIIADIQNIYLPAHPFVPRIHTSPKHRCRGNVSLPNSHKEVPSLLAPPSLQIFQSSWSNCPFILRRYAREWPAMREHPWNSAAYLRAASGPCRVVPVEVGQDYRENDWMQALVHWDTFLSHLELDDQPPPPEASHTLYLAQHDLLRQFPALRQDIIIPDYVYSDVHPSGYHPPGNDEQLIINTWFGPEGTVSPAHVDPYFNVFVQIVGCKTIWLAPPNLTSLMQPISSSNDGSLSSSDVNMSNTSKIDVFAETETQRSCEFVDKVVPHALGATLQPGDLLYLPPGWWHAMRSEETSLSVSMWF